MSRSSPSPRSLLAAAALPLAALAGCATRPEPAPGLPNLVILLIDDLGWRDIGAYGQDIAATPSIDRLARQGMLFTQAYAANPVCSPTRAALMTGKYPARVGIDDWIPGTPFPKARLLAPQDRDALPLAETTLAEALWQQGYHTWHVGKWHLGGRGFLPQDQGFDVNWMGRETGHPASHFFPYGNAHDDKEERSHAVRPLPPGGKDGDYLADAQATIAVDLIRKAARRDQRFFLYLSFYAVHQPIEAKAEALLRQQEARAERVHTAAPEDREAAQQALPKPAFAAMLENLDAAVGTVLAELEAAGVADNTLVVLTSDNGGLAGVSENRPLRGGKRSLWEGGIRVPLLVRWPGHVQAGSTSALPVITQDVHRGVRSAGGAPCDAVVARDGIDLLPVWLGGGPTERGPLFWHFPQNETKDTGPRGAIRDGDWKLIEDFTEQRVMLFDLASDPGEDDDLATSQPERASAMLQRLHAWRSDVGAAMPTPNPDYRPEGDS